MRALPRVRGDEYRGRDRVASGRQDIWDLSPSTNASAPPAGAFVLPATRGSRASAPPVRVVFRLVFKGYLYPDADSTEPLVAYVFEPALGRRVRVRLKAQGPGVFIEPFDADDLAEPTPAGEPTPTGDPAHRVDPRRTSIDADDFTEPAPDPAGARSR